MEIFSLFGSIFVDNEKANKGIDETNTLAGKLAKRFKKMGDVAKKVGKGIGVGLAAGGAAMIALATKTGEAADRLLDMSSITGMSTDELQKWEKVATVAGVSADAMSNVSQKLTKQMDILATGSGKASEAAEELGLSYDDLNNMNADERMNALVDALQGVEDPVQRAKLGTDLLGGSWKELAPILDVGKERLKDVKDNANIISNEDLNSANEFRISVDKMKERIVDFGQQLAVKFMPILNLVLTWFEENSEEIEAAFTTAFEFMGKAMDVFITFIKENVMPVIEFLVQWIKDHMPEIKAVFKFVFEAAKFAVDTVVEIFERFFLPIIEKVVNWIKDHMPEIKTFFEAAFEGAKIAVDVIIEVIQFLWDLLEDIYDFISTTFQKVGGWIKSAFEGVVDFIQDVIDVFDGIIEGVEKAIDAVKEFFDLTDKEKDESVSNSGAAGFSDFRSLGEEFTQENVFNATNNLLPPENQLALANQITNNIEIKEMNVKDEEDARSMAQELYNIQVETERGFGES